MFLGMTRKTLASKAQIKIDWSHFKKTTALAAIAALPLAAIDYASTSSLGSRNKFSSIRNLERFHSRLDDSTVVWLNQSEPKGFGEAVLRGRPFIGHEEFLTHAGDTYVIERIGPHEY